MMSYDARSVWGGGFCRSGRAKAESKTEGRHCRPSVVSYTDIQLKTFIHGMEVFNMKIIMRRDSVILSKSRNRLRQRRNLSD